MSLLIFIIVLSILIIFHEFGHFIMAKSLGVKVETFAVGFGPRLFSKTYRGTEFAICLIPLGGYIKMAGDERKECKGESDEFYSRPPGQRALIVLMGPVVNFILAYLCFCIIFVTGYPSQAPKVGEILKDSPAEQAGLLVNDEIVRIDSEIIQSWRDMHKYITRSKKEYLDFTIVRDGQEIQKTIAPEVKTLENIFGQEVSRRAIGIVNKDGEIIYLKYGIFQSTAKAMEALIEITTLTYKSLYFMATGAISPKDSVSGPVGIFFFIKEAASEGISVLIYVMAIISASLAIFNLLPLPVLDGGHLFLTGIEKLRGRPLSSRVEEAISRAGLSLLLCLALFVFYIDFVRYDLINKSINKFGSLFGNSLDSQPVGQGDR